MTAIPSIYFVQWSQTDSTFGPPRGWTTAIVTFDRQFAEEFANAFERTQLFENNTDVSELVSSVTRVRSEDQLLEMGADELERAKETAGLQLGELIEAWKRKHGDSD